ncbi:MAG: Asp23/Gls24 family envelope stress response protein [Lachnospiraceae bacterium]|nr:Asp23/Gls24 family envelope stress response protein [Lachnospiraceae bacterium]
MAIDIERKDGYKLPDGGVFGEVQIADEVVAIISSLAALEVEGVAKMSGNIPNELVSKLGMKNLSKGVKVEVSPESVGIELALEMKYGYSIPKVSEQVQEKVKSAIESMTGLFVERVDVRIVGVAIDKPQKPVKNQKSHRSAQIIKK